MEARRIVEMLCFFLFMSSFYLVGFGVLGYGVWAARRSTQVANWPTTQGNLANVALKENSDSDSGTNYEVKVEYTYTVDGQEYHGSRLAFGYGSSSNHQAQTEIYEKLKAAKSVDVRYDPVNPASSALSYGMHVSIRFVLAFAITWLAFVIGFTLLWMLSSGSDKVLLQNLSIH